MDHKRDVLADYLDQRITITGMIDRFDLHFFGVRQIRTALLQDVFAEVEGKQLDIGHVWVQHAESLKTLNLGCGDRIRCDCRVGSYKKRLTTPNQDGLMQVTKYNLSSPNEVEVIGTLTKTGSDDPAQGTVLPVPQDGAAPKTISLILEVKQIAQKVGGMDALAQLIEALRQ